MECPCKERPEGVGHRLGQVVGTRQMNCRVEKTSPFPMLEHRNFSNVGFCLLCLWGEACPQSGLCAPYFPFLGQPLALLRLIPGPAEAPHVCKDFS